MIAEAIQTAEANNQLQSNPGYRIYTEYQDDPVGFCRDVLGTTFTDDVIEAVCCVRDNVFTIARSANAIGKTHCAAHIALWFYKCFPGAQVYTTAAPPYSNLRNLLWGEIGKIIRRCPAVFADDTYNSMRLSRSEYEFVTGVAIPASGKSEEREAKFSGKHAPYLMFIVDESDAVPFEVFKGIEACISGGHVRVLAMFNPRNKSGKVFQMERNGEAAVVALSAFTHPNVRTGKDLIPGAVTRQRTIQRIHRWTRPLVAGEERGIDTFSLPSYLAGIAVTDDTGQLLPPLESGLRKVTDSEFFYMVLGEYPPQAPSQLISEEWVYNAQMRWKTYVALYGEKPPKEIPPMIGLDVADLGEDKNCLCLRFGGYVQRIQSWNGIDTLATGDKVAAIVKAFSDGMLFIDSIGVGTGVPVQVRRVLARDSGKGKFLPQFVYGVQVSESPTVDALDNGIPFATFKTLRDQIWWQVREWLRRDPGAMLPPDAELAQDLTTPTYEIRGKYLRIQPKEEIKSILGRSPDRAESLCLTFAPGNRTFKFNLV